MKHIFLLDENILYLAIKGVDAHENSDQTAARLVRLIGENCHRITMDKHLAQKYWKHIKQLLGKPSLQVAAVNFINQLLKNASKSIPEYSDLPEVPADATIPPKDIFLVRLALLSHPLVVTTDKPLTDAIDTSTALKLRALSPAKALIYAEET